MDYLVDTSALVASFSTTGISVELDGVTQTAGDTSNDFKEDLKYKVIAADGSSQEYTVKIEKNQVNHKAYIKPSNNSNYTHFGSAVALDGDTLVVGARYEDSSTTSIIHGPDLSDTNQGASSSGAVYVFKKVGESWLQEAYLKAPNQTENDQFGYAVAISGNTIVVGVPYEGGSSNGIIHGSDLSMTNDEAKNSGAAYVFVRNGSLWSNQAYLKAPNSYSQSIYGDRFGSAVAISGNTIVVGSKNEASGTNSIIHGSDLSSTNEDSRSSGAAYVYVREGDIWSHQAYLKAPNNDAENLGPYSDGGESFGYRVAIEGDTIAVSAYEDSTTNTIIHGSDLSSTNDEGSYNGAVYIFVRSDATWTHQAYLKAPNNSDRYFFGASISFSGDSIAISAPGENGATSEIINGDDLSSISYDSVRHGSVYIFTRSGGNTWSMQSYLKAPNNAHISGFGRLAFSGNNLAVGVFSEDSDTNEIIHGTDLSSLFYSSEDNDNGAAYLFTRTGNMWSYKAYLKAPNSSTGDYFGFVAISGSSIAVGATDEDSLTSSIINDADLSDTNNDGVSNGAVYIFR
jgi:hypothetical protein